MSQIIEAHVIVKYDTEANWNINPLILLKGQIAFVVDANNKPFNFKLGVGNKTFAQLPYMFDSPSFGSINTSTYLPTLPSGWYVPTEDGYYGSVLVDMSVGMTVLVWDGYNFTSSVFGLHGGLKLTDLTDVVDNTIPPSQFLVGQNGNTAKFRRIQSSDVIRDFYLTGTYVPSWNFTTNNWTGGNNLSYQKTSNSIPLRNASGRFEVSQANTEEEATNLGQIPVKLVTDNIELASLAESDYKQAGWLAYVKNEQKYYVMNDDRESFRPLINMDLGIPTAFTELSDTPMNYTGSAGKFLKVNVSQSGVVFNGLVATDFNMNNSSVNTIAVWNNGDWASGGVVVDVNEVGDTLVKRTTDGRVKVSDATDDNDAINLGQLADLIHLTFTVEINGKNYIVDKAPNNTEEFLEQGDLIYNVWVSGDKLETILMYDVGDPTDLGSWTAKGFSVDI